MKSKLVITVLAVMLIVVLASLSSALATIQSPPLTVSQQDYVWTVDLKLVGQQSGKNLFAIEAKYWINVPIPGSNPPQNEQVYSDPLTILKISTTDSQIKIWIDPAVLPIGVQTDGSYVMVTFNDGKEYVAHGPGPAYRYG